MMERLSDVCPQLRVQGRAQPSKLGPSITPRCNVTGHACLRRDGTGYRDCGPYMAARHNDNRLAKKAKTIIEGNMRP